MFFKLVGIGDLTNISYILVFTLFIEIYAVTEIILMAQIVL